MDTQRIPGRETLRDNPLHDLLKLAIKAALTAGDEILRIYNTDFLVETKSDNTPVTLADKTSGERISGILAESGLPVISEEERVPAYEDRRSWGRVWIVDPLDGTKEYVKRNGEFTVNIALVENSRPVIGVIYAPVLHDIWFGAAGGGSYKITQNDIVVELSKAELPDNLIAFGKRLPLHRPPVGYTVVASRSHLSREVSDRISNLRKTFGEVDLITVGSSIKQCWVAEGKAHEYPRYGKTMEWDTAAGQCILEEAGGRLVNAETMAPLYYNKEHMLNSFFIAFSAGS